MMPLFLVLYMIYMEVNKTFCPGGLVGVKRDFSFYSAELTLASAIQWLNCIFTLHSSTIQYLIFVTIDCKLFCAIAQSTDTDFMSILVA